MTKGTIYEDKLFIELSVAYHETTQFETLTHEGAL